jgi:hypothetical protein
MLGVAANLFGDGIGYWFARATDSFPESCSTLTNQASMALRQAVRRGADAVLDQQRKLVLNEDHATARIVQFGSNIIDRAISDEGEQWAADYLGRVGGAFARLRDLKASNDARISALLDAADTTLGRLVDSADQLDEVARDIRATAIDRSFRVLEEVKDRANQVRRDLRQIRFG